MRFRVPTRFPTINVQSARYIEMMMAGCMAMFFLAMILAIMRGDAQHANEALWPIGTYGALILFIEWRIDVEGFNAICSAARRLNADQKRALVCFLAKDTQ